MPGVAGPPRPPGEPGPKDRRDPLDETEVSVCRVSCPPSPLATNVVLLEKAVYLVLPVPLDLPDPQDPQASPWATTPALAALLGQGQSKGPDPLLGDDSDLPSCILGKEITEDERRDLFTKAYEQLKTSFS